MTGDRAGACAFSPADTWDGEIRESVRQIEINKVEYSIDLTLTTAINMILDGDTHLLYVNDTVPVAYLVMDGTTPEYYSQGDA